MKLLSAANFLLLLSVNARVVFGAILFNDEERKDPEPKRDVTLTLSSTKASFSATEPVLVDISLVNNESNKPARILSWVNPCNNDGDDTINSATPKEMSFFNIEANGRLSKYWGAVFKRGKPADKDYTILKAGEQISCTVDLSQFYEFSATSNDDNYTIEYSVASMQLSGPENNGNAVETVKSNIISVKAKARDAPSNPDLERNLRGLQSSSNTFNSCSSARQSEINIARWEAWTAAKNAVDLIASIATVTKPGCARYDEWFGTYSYTRHTELMTGYNSIYTKLDDAAIRFDCTCTTPGAYAYVYPSSPADAIYLCPAFWSAPMTGTDSKMGTIIHEMSHFTVTANTVDHAFGQSGCRSLADSDPARAINNADSHEYFAENTPILACYPTPAPAPSCMSGSTRVDTQPEESNGDPQYKNVRDLRVGDSILGLNEDMVETMCTVEAIGDFGVGPVYGNYTHDHFILNAIDRLVMPNGKIGEVEESDKYAVLTSCPLGVDESGIGFTPVDSDFLGDEPLAWSDYVLVHEALLNIVREVGPFVFSPSTYTSMTKVKQYTGKFYKTMAKCAKGKNCAQFEKAARDLVDNALTEEAKTKVKQGFNNFGNSSKPGSISAAVSKGKSVGGGSGGKN